MNTVKTAACALAATLGVFAATPAMAQVVVVEPYGGPYGYYGSYAYGGPAFYGEYFAFSPAYRYQNPYGYDTSGMPYSRDELGWQPGWRNGAPANPCWAGQRAQNRC